LYDASKRTSRAFLLKSLDLSGPWTYKSPSVGTFPEIVISCHSGRYRM